MMLATKSFLAIISLTMCVNQLVEARRGLVKRGPDWEERGYLDNPAEVYRRAGDTRATYLDIPAAVYRRREDTRALAGL